MTITLCIMEGELDPTELKRIEKLTISKLYSEGGSCTAAAIKEDLPSIKQTASIHHRCDPNNSGQSRLYDMGLVEPTGEFEQFGHNSSRVYALTEFGTEFVRTWDGEVEPPSNSVQLSKSIQHFENRVGTVEERSSEANKKAAEANRRIDKVVHRDIPNAKKEFEDTVNGYAGDLYSLQSTVDELHNEFKTVQEKQRHKADQRSVDLRLNDIEKRLDSIERLLVGKTNEEMMTHETTETTGKKAVQDSSESLTETIEKNTSSIQRLKSVVVPSYWYENEITISSALNKLEESMSNDEGGFW